MNDQLFSCSTFPMVKASNQVGLNMKVGLTSSRLKEIQSLQHLEHHGASYKHLKMVVSNSSKAQHLENSLSVSSHNLQASS